MRKVFLLGACRTPIGKMGGIFKNVPAVELGAAVIQDSLVRAKITADHVDHVIMGCVIQAGLGQNVARQAAVKAGLPFSTTAETLNVVCGSGLNAVNHGARMIQSGEADIVIAGGMESMSMAPYAMQQGRFGYRMGNGEMVDTMVHDALWEAFNDYHMGITAENVAKQWNISRAEMDSFAADSQQKACKAIENGVFSEEITPVMVKLRKGQTVYDCDEGPRPGVTAESLSSLKPAFQKDGLVTAGNSSGINDGAAAVILVSEEKVNEMKLQPMAQWMGGTLGGVDPSIMGIGPVVSTQKLLKKLNLTIDDMDLIEANEAFAAQSIAVARELHFPAEKLNVNGGAIALGHPVGASGCRILVTLLHEMSRRNAYMGLATLCIGGGMGCSVIVSRKVQA